MFLRKTNSRCLEVILFEIFILINFVSAVRINEIELNPAGNDAGNEWIEFYNPEEINLEGYKIINNDGDEINLTGTFSGYYIYKFEKQWLDNSDEKIFLYNRENLIFETKLFADNKNNNLTWNYCPDSDWQFLESTEKQENKCIKSKEQKIEEKEQKPEEKINKKDEKKRFKINKPKNKTLEIIHLNTKNLKAQNESNLNKKIYDLIKKYSIYFFVLIFFIAVLIKIKQNKLKENVI